MQSILFIGRKNWKETRKLVEDSDNSEVNFYYADNLKELKSLEDEVSEFDLVVSLNLHNNKLTKLAGSLGTNIDESRTKINKLCKNKFHTYNLARKFNVLQPKTKIFDEIEELESIIEEFDSKFVFIKPRKGSCSEGAGRYTASEIRQSKKLKKIKNLLNRHGDLLICEYIPSHRRKYKNGWLRIEARLFFSPITRNGRYIGPLYISGVQKVSEDFTQRERYCSATRHISNIFSQEGKNKKFLKKAIEEGEKVMNALYSKVKPESFAGPRILGLDFIIGASARNFQPYFLEINSSPLIVGWGNYKADEKVIKDFKNRFIPEVIASAKYLK